MDSTKVVVIFAVYRFLLASMILVTLRLMPSPSDFRSFSRIGLGVLRLRSFLLTWLLVTGGLLFVSTGLLHLWGPSLGIASAGLPNDRSTVSVFILDIVFASFLAKRTGGSLSSPFQPFIFLVPTVAIFLRQPTSSVIAYALASAAAFVFLARAGDDSLDSTDEPQRRRASIAFGLMAFTLAVGLGLIALPR